MARAIDGRIIDVVKRFEGSNGVETPKRPYNFAMQVAVNNEGFQELSLRHTKSFKSRYRREFALRLLPPKVLLREYSILDIKGGPV